MSILQQVPAKMQAILETVAHQASINTGLVKRHRKLTGSVLTQILVFGWLEHPEASYQQLTETAALLGIEVSRQALEQRLTPKTAELLKITLDAAIREVLEVASRPQALDLLQQFTGVYVQDSTWVSLPDELHEIWKGHPKKNHPKKAALKLHLRFDVLTGGFQHFQLTDGMATDWLLFPVYVKLIVPQTIRDKGDAVLKRICSKLPRGLILFDRGFARRKVFEMLLGLGHHILCRAKSNAVFYRLPKLPKQPQRGHPKKYGDRLNIQHLRYKDISILEKTYQVASDIVRTKMCPTDVRLVVIRARVKPSKPYRYFCVFTTDVTLEIPKIVEDYRQRWQIETAFRDAKQHFGFDAYRVKSRKSINRFVQLSFVAASLTKLIFLRFASRHASDRLSVKEVCDHLGIHWYHPKKLTQGLRVAYLQSQFRALAYSASSQEKTNSQNIHPISQHDNTLPFDKAA